MTTLLEKTRNITSILKRSEEKLAEELPYNAIADHLSAIIDCNSCIINSEGEVLGYHMNYETNNDRVEEFFQNKQFPESYVKAVAQVYDTQVNLPVESELTAIPVESRSAYPNGLTTIAPIHVTGIRFGSLIIWRNDRQFLDDDLILVEIAATVVGIQLLNFQREEDEKNIRFSLEFELKTRVAVYSDLFDFKYIVKFNIIIGDFVIGISTYPTDISKDISPLVSKT